MSSQTSLHVVFTNISATHHCRISQYKQKKASKNNKSVYMCPLRFYLQCDEFSGFVFLF